MEWLAAVNPEQKDFYFLDIGAGKFGWAGGTADYLNIQTDIPDDVNIHIISITGENHGPIDVQELGRCKLYNISAFKIESLKKSFEEIRNDLGFDLAEKLDLIVSSFTFIHLHDPVGTFVQAYNLLRPKNGYILMEGIPVFFQGHDIEQLPFNLIDLLVMTKAPFLIGPGNGQRWIESFLLKRPNELPLALPLKYEGGIETRIVHAKPKLYANFAIGADYIRPFNPDQIAIRRLEGSLHNPDYFYGDKDLYKWVYNYYNDWLKIDTTWFPLMKDDKHEPIKHVHEVHLPAKEKPLVDPIFEIASEGTLEEFKAAVNNDNVNKKDQGRPLIMNIEGDFEKIHWLLVESGLNVDINARDKRGQTIMFGWNPVEDTSFLEMRKKLFNMYLQKGANINIQDNLGNTPLHDAERLKAMDVVEWLLDHGADSSIKNKKGKAPNAFYSAP